MFGLVFAKETAVIRRPTIHKFISALLVREDYFPLTLTLSPIGGEGDKEGTLVMLQLLPNNRHAIS